MDGAPMDRGEPSGRTPPHNYEAEKALLAGLMLRDNVIGPILDAGLLPRHFADPVHGRIFQAMMPGLGNVRLMMVVTDGNRSPSIL